MKIYDSAYWDVDRIDGYKFGKGNNGIVYIDFGAEVEIGDVEGVE